MAILPLRSVPTPHWLVSSAWIEHGPFAFWIVDALRPRLTVELGSYAGYSFCCFCEQIKRSGIDGRAIAIDTWQGDEHGGFYGDKIFDRLATYTAKRYPGMAELKRMTFADALQSVADKSVDLLHVDGRHFYDDVVEDFTAWVPKLSDRAVVLFHDTQVRERGFGVHRFWAELAGQYPHFEFPHCNGLGVLGFGSTLPPVVKSLFEQTADAALTAETCAAFAAAGRKISRSYELRRALTSPKHLRNLARDAIFGSRG